jgi:hypothetical protein
MVSGERERCRSQAERKDLQENWRAALAKFGGRLNATTAPTISGGVAPLLRLPGLTDRTALSVLSAVAVAPAPSGPARQRGWGTGVQTAMTVHSSAKTG